MTFHLSLVWKVEAGGTAAEALPTPEKSIQQLEREEKNPFKHREQLSLFDQPPEDPSVGH